ncbi:MAG: C_GCAxxG_C_C family protein [Clostridiales bacterium]|nr:C_GCAxxG_C_C family protein [Clostridiales bacterium]
MSPYAQGKVDRARELYLSGYNCAQAVFAAFAEEMKVPVETALKIASGMGGGIGGLRETCGAVSAMALVLGTLRGYNDAADYEGKKELYAAVQRLHGEFCKEYETSNCRQLLISAGIAASNVPAERTPEYYRKRPCYRYIEKAAQLLAEELEVP